MRALLPVGEGRLHAAGLDALQPLSQQATVATHVVPAELAVVAAAVAALAPDAALADAAALAPVAALAPDAAAVATAAAIIDVDALMKRHRRDPRRSEGRPGSGPQRPRDPQHRVGVLELQFFTLRFQYVDSSHLARHIT